MKEKTKIAVIFAGGKGVRMNNRIPKQLLKIKNKEILLHVIDIFENSKIIDKIYISFIPELIEDLENLIKKHQYKKPIKIVPGGCSGQESIYNSLKLAAKENPEDSVVFIHDGVRPFVCEQTLVDNYKKTIERGNSITVSVATETVAIIGEDETVGNIFDRSKCYLAQAPQTFFLKDILKAHEKEMKNKTNYDKVIDSSTLVAKHFPKTKLNIVIGDPENIKITRENDLIIAKAYFDFSKKFMKEDFHENN